jgi:hypothetical protein
MDNAANSLMTALIDAGNIDTVYRDVYLDRARTLLAPVLSREEFHRLEQQRAALAELPATIAHALETANWSLVKELSEHAQQLKRTIDDKAALLQTARSVYDVRDIRLDPFSPGLQSFTRIPTLDLATLRRRAVELLGRLEWADVAWNDFYAARQRAFQARPQNSVGHVPTRCRDLVANGRAGGRPTSPESRRHEPVGGVGRRAERRGEAGQTVLVVRCERRISSRRGRVGSGVSAGRSPQRNARARRLGLASRHLEPRMELASLRQYAWTPLSDERGNSGAAQLRLPSGMPEGLRDGLAVFMIHPLVNSGGAR